MLINQRREQRHAARDRYSLCWRNDNGQECSAEVRGIEVSQSGIRVLSPRAVPVGTIVFLQAIGGALNGYCVVRHCTPQADRFAIGLEFHEDTRATASVADTSD